MMTTRRDHDDPLFIKAVRQINLQLLNNRRFFLFFRSALFFIGGEKKENDQSTFNEEITTGTVLEMINASLSGGLTSIFTLVLPETGFILKAISTSSSESSLVTALPPLVVVKMPAESLVPCVRVTGALPGVEKTISMVVMSTDDA